MLLVTRYVVLVKTCTSHKNYVSQSQTEEYAFYCYFSQIHINPEKKHRKNHIKMTLRDVPNVAHRILQ